MPCLYRSQTSDFISQTSAFKRDNKMKIDRHNYEEFFILYWDNELTASQKQAVENFVTQNADLHEEFKILGETRFTPDNRVQLEEREFLQNKPFINITNYEEQLLNYIDDELGDNERKEVERSVAKYPNIQKELFLLQRTKFQPEEEVSFPDKSTLHRREEKVRVISMTWFRVAAAAAIILIAGFVTLRLVNTDNSGTVPPIVNADKSKDQAPNNKTDRPITQPQDQPRKDKDEILATVDDKSTKKKNINNPRNKKSVKETNDQNPLVAYKPENKNNLPKEGARNNQTTTDPNALPEELIAYNLPKDKNQTAKTESNASNDLLDNSSVTKSSPVAFAKVEDGGVTPDKEKGGLKEFLRKTTRVFERRTKIQTTTEDNKLLLGAFAVSLK